MDPRLEALTGAFLVATPSLGALVRVSQCMVMASHQALPMVNINVNKMKYFRLYVAKRAKRVLLEY